MDDPGVQDPAEGQEPDVQQPESSVAAAPDPYAEKFQMLTDEFRSFKEQMSSWRMPQQQQMAPAPPVEPPKFEFYSPRQIAKAVEEGDHETAEAMREHNGKTRQDQFEFRAKGELDQLRMGGQAALDQIADQVYKGEFKHLDIPEVKKDYESQLRVLQAQGVSINPEARRYIYRQSVGSHVDKVLEKEKQGMLRQGAVEPQGPSGKSGRQSGKMGEQAVPTPEEVWGKEGLNALRMAGRTVEEELKRRGYKDWPSYAKQMTTN